MADRAESPQWSVMIPAWNGGPLLERTIRSVIVSGLDLRRAQIEVVDDASTDDTAARVERLAAELAVDHPGATVGHWRQPANVGAVANFTTCIERARGDFVHILHGDDLVRPGFYAALTDAMRNPRIGAAMCRTALIDEDDVEFRITRAERDTSGVWENALETLTVSNRVFPPAIVVRRSVYAELGGFRADLPHAADWEMWTRIAAHRPIWFENRTLAAYRIHGGQDTGPRMRSGENIRERVRCIDVLMDHVEVNERRARRRNALLYSALFAGRTAAGFGRRGEWAGAAAQVREAARCVVGSLMPSALVD